MKNFKFNRALVTGSLLLSLSLLVLTGCTSTQTSSDAAIQTRNNLTALQQDPNLGNRARNEMSEAEQAVQLAEKPVSEPELNAHRVYLAKQKIEIARAKASANYSEEQRERLSQERDDQRLQSRTAEADRARGDADRARSEAYRSRTSEAELQRQLAALKAEPTDRGIVLTLGDVLFATGSAELRAGADANLERLAKFLNDHPERSVKIEGHTDSTGNRKSNQELSRNRADSVRTYLVGQGIAADRLSSSGRGQDRPIASNDSALGRQQNRRVEVIIEN